MGEETVKPNLVVGIIGPSESGKTTLACALAKENYNVERTMQEMNVQLSNLYHLQSTKYNYTLIDVPNEENLKNMLAWMSQLDVAILVVSTDYDRGVVEMQVKIAKYLRISQLIVFYNLHSTDIDSDIRYLEKVELKETLKSSGFANKAKIIFDSAQKALTDEGIIAEVIAAMDAELEIPEREITAPFSLQIMHHHNVKDEEKIVVGKIDKGTVNVGDTLRVGETSSQVKCVGIQICEKTQQQAQAGEIVGLRLEGGDKNTIKRGMVLTTDPEIEASYAREFSAQISTLPEKQGRHTPFFPGYMPIFYFFNKKLSGKISLEEGNEMIMPGEINQQVCIKFSKGLPPSNKQQTFVITDENIVVGTGVITERASAANRSTP